MLEYFLTVDKQILAMMLMVVVGYIIYRKGMISDKGLADMSQLLLKIVTPMILITSFQRQFTYEAFLQWLIMFGVTVLSYAVLITAATLFFYNKKEPHCPENRLAVVFPNNGFMAIPLMLALAGEEGVFLGSTNIILLNILFWTYGTRTFCPEGKFNIRQALLNPGTIAVAFGLLLFVAPWKLPEPVFEAVDSIGSLNTPVAMIVLGGFLAQTDLKACLRNKAFYKMSAIKLLLIPCVMFAILAVLPLPPQVRVVASICSVTPTATAVSMLADIYNRDFRYASGAVVITTVISAITIPLMMTLAKAVLGF
ncbi:AEC family transporter [Ructibacterium gallinarum]|uniref:AEC family transporter n=1 Tax=Ructibacterium gallinarum TaxID=2779355 RepID=A0A9D5M221_9FIRM|nr:AEC family transporter [Ructibacterium gallinarum]MBE5040013.1 AEC family transporter [Ructibacterium gallinarum]